MTRWWENIQYRIGLMAVAVLTVGTAAILAVAAVVNPSDGPSWPVVVLVPLVQLLVLVAALILVLQPWNRAADITAMRAGEAWVHWTYDEASWRAANRYDEQRNTLWVHAALTALAVGGLMLLIGIPGGHRTLGVATTGGVVTFGATIFLALLTLGDPGWVARRAARGEIYISRHGIYRQPGGYTPLDQSYRTRYESADLVDWPEPHIHIEVSTNANAAQMWIRKTLTDVGVPPGHEDEARTVVELLRRHVLTRLPPTSPDDLDWDTRQPPSRPEAHKWEPRQSLDDG